MLTDVWQIVVVTENLPTSLSRGGGGYECRYTSARFAHSTAVIQFDELTDAGQTALKCETPLSQQLPQFNDRHGQKKKSLFYTVKTNINITRSTQRAQTSADPEDPDFGLWTPGSEA